MIAQTVLVSANLPFKIKHAVLVATSAYVQAPLLASCALADSRASRKRAHSDLLQAIPQPPAGPLTFEQKCDLSRPFIHVRPSPLCLVERALLTQRHEQIGYDPAFIQNPRVRPSSSSLALLPPL